MSHLLVVSSDPVGTCMAGPGIRAWELSRQLARENDVRLAAPALSKHVREDKPTLIPYEADGAALREQIAWADVIVTQAWSTVAFPFLVNPSKVLVFDLYNLSFLENLVAHADDEQVDGGKEYHFQFGLDLVRDLLTVGDFFLCANDRQRHFWLGWLTALGRVNHLAYQADSTLRRLIDVVPFGLPDEPPRHTAQVLKGVFPGIDRDDRVILWNGGMWEWLDPVICVEAVHRLSARRPDVKLFFLSTSEVGALPSRMTVARRARELSDEYGLTDRQIFFNETWAPYDQRQNYLLEADVGLLAHAPHIETAFSNRTRLLDCVWAGLPIVTVRGDVMSEWVERHDLGQSVKHDADQIAQAIQETLATPREQYRRRFERLADRFTWSRSVKPLVRFCAHPAKAPDRDAALVAAWGKKRASSIARRESDLADAYQKQEELRDHIRAIQQGRVMRMLNRLERWWSALRGKD